MDASKKITAMRTGGRLLGQIREQLADFTKVGMTFAQIEVEAQRLIKATGATPSFSTVPGYKWATCIMKNDGLCHGIPNQTKIENGDVVTIDVGLIYDGYHLDTTTTFLVTEGSVPKGPDATGLDISQKKRFLELGRKSLRKSIDKVKAGQSVYAVSLAMEKVLDENGLGIVYQLTGHGVGEKLHMEPSIPCVAQKEDKKVFLYEGQTVAVEVMYTAGEPDLKVDSDGWTYRTTDGSLSGMFEETVLVTKNGCEILTNYP
jgi:methionyl aminopeptidase